MPSLPALRRLLLVPVLTGLLVGAAFVPSHAQRCAVVVRPRPVVVVAQPVVRPRPVVVVHPRVVVRPRVVARPVAVRPYRRVVVVR